MSAMEEMAVKFVQKLVPPSVFEKIDDFIKNAFTEIKAMREQQMQIASDVAYIKMCVSKQDQAELIMHRAIDNSGRTNEDIQAALGIPTAGNQEAA